MQCTAAAIVPHARARKFALGSDELALTVAFTIGGRLPVAARWMLVQQRRHGVTSFNPRMPDTINPTHSNLTALAGSSKSTMPTTTVPTVPIPVQIA
jgi:hypothetical protein